MKLLSLRKTQLQNKISEAIQLGDQDHLIYLRSKLVHRYGIDALNDSEIEIKDLLELSPRETSRSSPSLEIEQAELPTESNFINNPMSQDLIKDEAILEIPDYQNSSELPENGTSVSSQPIEKIPSDLPPLPLAPTPPIPRLSSLRRWLTPSEEDMPKAS